jgi:type VI secretion system protein ImpH
VGAKNRTPGDSLDETLVEKAWRFSFFQLIRLLERHAGSAARVGGRGPASDEAVRLRPEASLGFPASDVAGLRMIRTPGRAAPRYQITTSFLGLYGTTSPLPSFYSEEILWGDPDNNRVRDFLDIFHHRLISLFYRSWCKYRYHIEFEHGKNDPFTPRLFALIGLGTPALGQAAGVPQPERFIHFAGLFHQQPHSASALENILSDYFDDLPVQVDQCTGRWIPIRQEQQAALGRNNCRLGEDCTLGSRVFGRRGSFRIVVGPVMYDQFLEFLPDRQNHRTLRSIAGFFVKDRLEFDVRVRACGWPRSQLLSQGPAQAMSRLGWTSWLFSDPPERDMEMTVNFSRDALLAVQQEPGRSQ